MKRILAGALFALVLPRAASAECNAPFVALEWDDRIPKGDRLRIASELRADLRDRAIDVCEQETREAPAARVAIEKASEGVSIRLEVRDAITSKDLARTIDTSKIPADGRALAIALAVAELLRASWAELALHDAPPPPVPVPPQIIRIVETSVRSVPPVESPRIFGLFLAFASEAFTSGFARFGADVRASIDVGPRFSFSLGGGFRRALSATGPDGHVDAEALVFSVDASYALLARTRTFGIDPFARFSVVPVTFQATPTNGATASPATLVALEASGGVRGRWSLTKSFALVLEIGGGATLRSAEAKDGDRAIATTSGAMLSTALGLQGRF